MLHVEQWTLFCLCIKLSAGVAPGFSRMHVGLFADWAEYITGPFPIACHAVYVNSWMFLTREYHSGFWIPREFHGNRSDAKPNENHVVSAKI